MVAQRKIVPLSKLEKNFMKNMHGPYQCRSCEKPYYLPKDTPHPGMHYNLCLGCWNDAISSSWLAPYDDSCDPDTGEE